MIQPYPLYDTLVTQVANNQDKNIDIKCVCNTINMLSQTSEDALMIYREIAALIFHHDIIYNNGILLDQIPYGGKVMVGGKGLLMTIMNLPPNLQQIIAQFIENLAN
jgi:hypothetical protein